MSSITRTVSPRRFWNYRLARSLQQLVAITRELKALGIDLVVLDQEIDTTTPTGRCCTTYWAPLRSSSVT